MWKNRILSGIMKKKILCRFDSLLMVAGGSGITPFLSILAEIDSATSKTRFPSRIQLIYVIKKAQDFCLLHSISHLLLSQSTEKCHLKLKLFVTQETQAGVGIRELLNELFKVRTLQLNTACSNYAVHGPESSTRMAAIAGFCSIIFLIFLICFNHTIIPSGKRSKLSKENTPSWVVDLLLIAAFVLALACSTLMAIILRCRRLKQGFPPTPQKEIKPLDLSSAETRNVLEEHEVHFGGRPNFKGSDLMVSFLLFLIYYDRTVDRTVLWIEQIYLASSRVNLVDPVSESWCVDLRAWRNLWRLHASRNPSVSS